MTFRPFNKFTAVGISDSKLNDTGATIPKLTPVRSNSGGTLDFIDVSVESEARAIIGVVENDILDAAYGSVVTSGKITDIGDDFDFGDTLFVSKTGELTNIPPERGNDGFLADDWGIQVGVVTKNSSNPLLKDLTLILGDPKQI